MNDNWITSSLNSHGEYSTLDGVELWIDCMGLLETGWLLFAGGDRYKRYDYGYPGTPKKFDKPSMSYTDNLTYGS